MSQPVLECPCSSAVFCPEQALLQSPPEGRCQTAGQSRKPQQSHLQHLCQGDGALVANVVGIELQRVYPAVTCSTKNRDAYWTSSERGSSAAPQSVSPAPADSGLGSYGGQY